MPHLPLHCWCFISVCSIPQTHGSRRRQCETMNSRQVIFLRLSAERKPTFVLRALTRPEDARTTGRASLPLHCRFHRHDEPTSTETRISSASPNYGSLNAPRSVVVDIILISSYFGFSRHGSPQRIFHLQLFLPSASSSVTSTTAMSSFTTSINLLLELPRFLFPYSSILGIFLPIYPSYLFSLRVQTTSVSPLCVFSPNRPICTVPILILDIVHSCHS